MNQTSLSFLLLWITSLVTADSLRPVYKHGCVALQQTQKIHCYGGAFRKNKTETRIDTYFFDDELYDQHIYLDVSKPLNVSFANTQWQPVPPPPSVGNMSYQFEARADFAIAAYNAKSFMISGGIGPTLDAASKNQTFSNITMLYDAEKNVWSSMKQGEGMPDDIIGNTFDSQLFGQRAAQISDSEYVVYGGIPPNNNTVLRWNTTFVDVTRQDDAWDYITVNTLPLIRGHSVYPDPSRRYRGVPATDYTNSNVLLFGGLMPQNATNNHNYLDFITVVDYSSVIIYYPSRQQFEEVKTTSLNDFPDYRELNTVTSIPKVNKVILYGGVNERGAMFDFCWLFDVPKRQWESVKFTNGDGAGRRFGHQAIMVGSDMLYIIGGVDALGVTQNDVHILNVTSMTWLNGSYTNTYDQMMDAEAAIEASSSATSSVSLSAGAIAGIVIGCVAGVAILVAAIAIVYLQRKKKAAMIPSDAPEGFESTMTSPSLLSDDDNVPNKSKPDAFYHSSSVKPST